MEGNMRWFRIFLSLFILSLIATGASFYWKTYYPASGEIRISMDEKSPALAEPSPAPAPAGSAADGTAAPADEAARGVQLGQAKPAAPAPGENATVAATQDLANMLSIVSSVVSLAGTIVSLMFAMFMSRRGAAS
jgi:hypothetical protein